MLDTNIRLKSFHMKMLHLNKLAGYYTHAICQFVLFSVYNKIVKLLSLWILWCILNKPVKRNTGKVIMLLVHKCIYRLQLLECIVHL